MVGPPQSMCGQASFGRCLRGKAVAVQDGVAVCAARVLRGQVNLCRCIPELAKWKRLRGVSVQEMSAR